MEHKFMRPGFKLMYHNLQFAIHLRELVIQENLKTNKIVVQKFVGKTKLNKNHCYNIET